MAVVTFVDDRDGTGGVFTISGGGSSDVHTIWVSQFHGMNSGRTFVSAGTRTGNGTVAWTNSGGCFIGHVSSLNGSTSTLSNPISFRVTDGSVSLYERFLMAMREYVLSLNLAGVASDPERHVITKYGAKLDAMLAQGSECVYYIPTAEVFGGLDNAYASVQLPVNVIVMTKTASTLSSGMSGLLLSREEMHNAFMAVPLPDLGGEIHSVDVKPGMAFDPKGWAQGYDVSVLQFIGKSEQVDGLL